MLSAHRPRRVTGGGLLRNNLRGRPAISGQVHGDVMLGFPGAPPGSRSSRLERHGEDARGGARELGEAENAGRVVRPPDWHARHAGALGSSPGWRGPSWPPARAFQRTILTAYTPRSR